MEPTKSLDMVSPTQSEGGLPPVETLTPETIVARKEIGRSGTLISGGGFISGEEYNTDLKGRAGMRVYDQMRKSDATVKASLQVVKLPILASDYTIQSASDNEQDTMIAEFVRENLFKRINFTSFLREVLTMFDFGFSVFEKVYDFDNYKGKPYVMLKKASSRKPLTVMRWQTQDAKAGISQMTYTGGMYSIPQEKLLIFTNEQEGDNFEGVSILRSAYKHWYFKENLYKIQAISMERQGVGIPVGHTPNGVDEPGRLALEEALQNIRANELADISVPEGYTIEFMDMKGTSVIDCSTAIDHHDRQIMKNVLAQFIEIGSQGSSGTRNVSEDQSKLFQQSLEAATKKICEVINDHLIKQLVDFNFNTDAYPTLSFGSLSDDNVQTLAESLQKLTNVHLITPDAELEQHLRTEMKLPDLPDDIAKDYNNRPQDAPLNDPFGAKPAEPAKPGTPSTSNPDVPTVTAQEIIRNAEAYRDRLGKQIDAISRRG